MPVQAIDTRRGDRVPVSSYSMKKYFKAGAEFALADVLVYLTFRFVLSTTPPPDFVSTHTLLLAVIVFILIALYVFAIANIFLGYLNKEEIWTLKSLRDRALEIEKRIPVAGLVVPPTEPEPPQPEQRPSKKKMIAAIAVASIIVVASMMATIVIASSYVAPQAGGATAEQAFDNLVNRMNAHDAAGMIDQTIFKFDVANRTEYINGVGQFLSDPSMHVTVNWRNVINKTDIPLENRTHIEENVTHFEQWLGIEVDDYCVISFNITITSDQGTMYQQERFLALLVDGLWYIVLEFGDGGPGGEDPETVFDNFIDDINNGDYGSAFNETVLVYSNDQQQAYQKFVEETPNGTFIVTSTNVRYEAQLNATENQQRMNLIQQIEQSYGVSVQDYCVIDVVGSIQNNSGNFPTDMTMPMMKIEDKWLLVFTNDSSGQQPITVLMTMVHASNNWTFTVTGVNGTSMLSTSQVRAVAFDNSSNEQVNQSLDSLGGGFTNGVAFMDNPTFGELNGGDIISLMESVYGSGSRLRLTSMDGTEVYYDNTFW